VLNELVSRDGALVGPRTMAEFRLAAGGDEVAKQLRDAGWLVFVFTNQPDIARGLLKQSELDLMTAEIRRVIQPHDIRICPHDDADQCACRKPKPGMLLDLGSAWNLDLKGSFVIGDTWRDVEAGRSAGCHTIFLAPPGAAPEVAAEARIRTLSEALPLIGRCEQGP
jgi:D-glycero-D-manno-heptose 1,7-bisphosphate phosphatase